jgi:ribulose-5-phosphate 4-epimerase/fuculose-1-phosphate aldolase
VTIDLDGKVLNDPKGLGINKAGFTIHSAVHAARPDIACVMHTHTVAGVAVASLKDGLLPLNQWSAPFFNRISYHDYEGIALNHEERDRIVNDLGSNRAMILRNHGLLTCGRSVGEAFRTMMDLERACRAQVAIMGTGGQMNLLSDELAEHTAQQEEGWIESHQASGKPDTEWEAYLRHCKARYPDFDQ